MTFHRRIDSVGAHGIITQGINVPGSGLIMSQFSLYHLFMIIHEIVIIFSHFAVRPTEA